MFLFRRATLWVGCALLALAYCAAEELVGASAGWNVARRPELAALVRSADAASDSRAWAYVAGAGEGVDLVRGPGDALPEWARRARRLYRICRVTAYCDRGTTAAGVPSGVGQCAAPGDIPFGSIVYIPALDRYFVVTDRTHKRFRHNTVDLFIPSAERCRQFGRHYLECEILVHPDPPRYGDVRVLGTGG